MLFKIRSHIWHQTALESLCSFSQVEEGWWSGSFNGRTGVFPSNFVKELDAAGEEQESNSTAADEAGESAVGTC